MSDNPLSTKIATVTTTTTTADDKMNMPIEKKKVIVLTNNSNTDFEQYSIGAQAHGSPLVKTGVADYEFLKKIVIHATPVKSIGESNEKLETAPPPTHKSIEKITIQAVSRTMTTSESSESSNAEDANKSDAKTYVIKKPISMSHNTLESVTPAVAPVTVTQSAIIPTEFLRLQKINLAQQPLVSVKTAQNKTIMVKMIPHNFTVAQQKTLSEKTSPNTSTAQDEVLVETTTFAFNATSDVTESVAVSER
jgi:hypothetical protein